MTKEKVYDEQINPMMAKIIEICKAHKIAMICDFALDDDGLHCTSALLEDEFGPSAGQLYAYERLKPRASTAFAMAETIETKPDGSKHITLRRRSREPHLL